LSGRADAVKTILVILMFLVSAGATFAQSVEHRLKVFVYRDDEQARDVRLNFILVLENNPHFTIVNDAAFDISVSPACMPRRVVSSDLDGYFCAVHYTYWDEWGITYSFGTVLLSGSDTFISKNMLGDLKEFTTPDSLARARQYTHNIAENIKLKTLLDINKTK
jgi:hypothetical protein